MFLAARQKFRFENVFYALFAKVIFGYIFSLRDPLMESLALHWWWIVESCHEMFRPEIGI